jgi:putative ABC transport system permease protein
MFRFMLQKLLHKKWMFISLLIGNILLIAITSSNPMYKNASLQRMLTDDFVKFLEEKNDYPSTLFLKANMDKKSGVQNYKIMKQKAETIANTLGIPEIARISHYYIQDTKAKSLMGRADKKDSQSLRPGYMSDLENHITMVSGSMYSNQITNDGFIEAIVSKEAFSELNLVVGEEFEFDHLTDQSGDPVKLRITGVFDSSNQTDNYWINNPNSYTGDCFISEEVFTSNFLNLEDQRYNMMVKWFVLLDYTSITPSQVDNLLDNTTKIIEESKTFTSSIDSNYIDILKSYHLNEKKIIATLMILQVPVLVLLCSFIFMISSQMLDMEQNEIAMLKSRGSGKGQIIFIYMIQSIFVACISILLGLPLGAFLCKALGSTSAFLEFIGRRALKVTITPEVLIYAFAAVFVSISVMVLPVFKHANVTIVNYKQKKNKKNKSLWKRIYLDFVILAISLYGLYNFTEQKDLLTAKVLTGNPLDPFLYLSSSLFIVGASLVALRIQPLLVKLIYLIGKKRWKPAAYASFLQIIRTGSKQSFIMVFLMFTIALGIFNSTVARTILSNADANIKYETGADIVMQEVWSSNEALLQFDPFLELMYKEPDFGKYENLEGVEAAAKVRVANDVEAVAGKEKVKVKLMGIDTKDFGKTSWFKDGLLPMHYYEYLNSIAGNSDAVLVSSNFRDKFQFKIGDIITYRNKERKNISGVIYGFVDFWPTYEPTTTTVTEAGNVEVKDNYLIVAHLSLLQENWGLRPYQVWLNAKDSTNFIYDFVKDNKVSFSLFEDVSDKLIEVRNDTMFQGTNGILTMSFIIVLILSCAGFLIYWILSIRSRELLFGVFRAMGMSKKEVIQMLINEQIFSTGISILMGALIGTLSSRFFVPLIQIAYASTTQFIPLELITEQSDMIRLFTIIAGVFILCMIILRSIISKIKISQALKLGED